LDFETQAKNRLRFFLLASKKNLACACSLNIKKKRKKNKEKKKKNKALKKFTTTMHYTCTIRLIMVNRDRKEKNDTKKNRYR